MISSLSSIPQDRRIRSGVIPAAAMTGEAAGTAAALAAVQGCDPKELDIETLRDQLRKNNFRFHLEECGLEVRS